MRAKGPRARVHGKHLVPGLAVAFPWSRTRSRSVGPAEAAVAASEVGWAAAWAVVPWTPTARYGGTPRAFTYLPTYQGQDLDAWVTNAWSELVCIFVTLELHQAC